MALLAICHVTVYKTEDNLVAAFLFIGLQCEQSIRKHSLLPSQKKKVQETFTSEVIYSATFLAVVAYLKHFFIQLKNLC